MRDRRLVMDMIRENRGAFVLQTQRGAALVIAIMILLVLTVIGIYAVTTSTIDTKISGYQRFNTNAFYAADAGIDFVLATNPFADILCTNPPCTPSPPNPYTNPAGAAIQFQANVTYQGDTPPPPEMGIGMRAGFWAYHYELDSAGTAPNATQSSVQVRGFRLGFM